MNRTIKVIESEWVFSKVANTDEKWNAAQIVIYPQQNNIVVRYKNILCKFTLGNFEEYLLYNSLILQVSKRTARIK